MKNRIVMLFVLLMFFSSCYTKVPIAKVMDTYIGMSEDELQLKLGAPTNITLDGTGGKIINYQQTPKTSVSNPKNPSKPTSKKEALYKDFYINAQGNVSSWKTNYPNQKGELDKKKTKTTIIASILCLLAVFINYTNS